MHALLSRLFGWMPFWRPSRPTPEPAADLPTEHVPRKPLAWSSDGDTLRLRKSSSGRIAWPARDRVRDVPTGRAAGDPILYGDDAPTRLVEPEPAPAAAIPADYPPTGRVLSGDATRYVGSDETMSDAVVGWLVIVEGAGRGHALAISAGQNPIGRGPDQKLRLDFGDRTISRERHGIVVYDPVSRRFYLQAGDGRSLIYVDKNLVLAPVELNDGAIISVGDTQLRFVAFCGPQFSW